MADGEILFKAGMDTAGFESGSKRIKQSADATADAVKSSFERIGNIISGELLANGLENLLSKMAKVQRIAQQFGTSAEAVQRIGGAADQVGTSLDNVANAMRMAGVAASKAANDGSEAWKNIGIDAAAFAAGDLEARVKMVGAAMQSVGGDQRKMAELFDVIGAKAAGINFAKLVTEMQNVNVVSNELVKQLSDANDMLDRMKNNATVLGANLLKALVIDPAERLGSMLSGQGPATNAEADQMALRERARANLEKEQMLRPEGDYQSVIGPEGIAMPVANDAEVENLRLIAAEMERIRNLESEITTQTVATADAVDTVADKTKQRAEAAEHIRELALEIKEAENAGNDALVEKLRYQKDYETALDSNLGSEDAYGMAVREANANLEARNKLLAEQLKRTHENVEAELEYAETMAYGNDQEKGQAEWMKAYRASFGPDGELKPGITEDQAQRAANLATYKPDPESGGGGGGGGGGGSRARDPLTPMEQLGSYDTTTALAAAMKLEDRQTAEEARASKFRDRGFYETAANIYRHAKENTDKQASSAAADQRAKTFGYNNADEQYNAQKNPFDEFWNTKDGDKKSRAKWDKEQAAMAKEGATEDPSQPGGGGKGKGGGGDAKDSLLSKVTEIHKWMTDNLPSNALTS
jgi:hypothetical protein